MSLPGPYIPQSPCPVCIQSRTTLASRRSRRREPLLTVACNDCGLFRNDPLPTSEELRRFHEVDYRESYKGVRTPKARNVYRSARLAKHRLGQLRRWLPASARILDVGSGSGEWLNVLQQAGHRVSGVEADPFYGEFARRQYGVEVETAGILDLTLPENSLDVITMFHVLEHLPNPVAVLQRLHGWLRPGGLLIVEVPNTNCLHQHPAGRFHSAHVIGFTAESLDYAGQAGGWQRLELSLGDHDRNLLAVFRKPEAGEAIAPPALPKTLPSPLLTTPATVLRYYFRASTYTRWLARMAQFAGELLAVRGVSRSIPIPSE